MIQLNQENLLAFLNREGYETSIQEDTQQVVHVFKIESMDFPAFFRIADEGLVLQIVTFFPFTYLPTTITDTARMLHLLNKEIDLPGFGMDETSGTIFYRASLGCPEKELQESILSSTLNAIKFACQNFAGAVAAVASGKLSFEEALKKASEFHQG